jgi:predicted nucleotidyltransferase
VIELLFVDPSDVLMANELGELVRTKRDLFLSAKAKHTFTGYAISQLKRINTHRRWLINPPKLKPNRSDFGLPESSIITSEQRGAAESLVNSQIREWLGQDSDLGQTELSIFHERLTDFISRILSSKELILELKDEKELIRTARIAAMEKIGMAKNYIAILQTEKEYRDQLQEWNQYQQWKENRNPARAELEAKYGYDTKHGMQLVRLLVAGKEILMKGTFTVKSAETEMLLKVKRGEWSYDEIIKYLKSIDKELQDIYDNKKYVVPHKPDMNALNELCMNSIRSQLDFDRRTAYLRVQK